MEFYQNQIGVEPIDMLDSFWFSRAYNIVLYFEITSLAILSILQTKYFK